MLNLGAFKCLRDRPAGRTGGGWRVALGVGRGRAGGGRVPRAGVREGWRRRAVLGLAGWALLAATGSGQAQRPSHWRFYRAADGLSESLTTSITVGPRGNVWVKHGEVDAISLLDGYSITRIPAPGERNYRVYESRAGRIWSVYADGLMEFVNGTWERYPLEALRKEHKASPLRPLRQMVLLPAEEDRVLVLLSDRLVEFRVSNRTPKVLRLASDTGLGRFLDLVPAADDGAWLSASGGIARLPGPLRQLKAESEWEIHPLPAALEVQNLQRPFEDDDRGLTMVGDSEPLGRRVLVHYDGTNWLTRAWPTESLRFAWRDQERGVFWGATLSTLVRFRGAEAEQVTEGVLSGQYFDVAVQPRGIFWVATLEGLMRYAPPTWQVPPEAEGMDTPVHALIESEAGVLWLASTRGLVSNTRGRWESRAWPTDFEPGFRAGEGLFLLADGRLAVCTGDAFWTFDPGGVGFQRVTHPESRRLLKILRQFPDGSLCVQTAEPDAAPGQYRFERFDGREFRPWPEGPPPFDLGGELFFLAQAQSGDWWLGGSAGPAVWREGRWQRFGAADNYQSEGALCWLELRDGRIWCAGLGRISEFDGKTWTQVRGGLDRVSALIATQDGSIWVATGTGLFRYYRGSWAAVGEEEGLPGSACYAVIEGRDRRLWVGTSRGPATYVPRADIDPPETLSVVTDQTTASGGESAVQVAFQGRDKWRQTPDERLLYSYRVDAGEWAPFGGQSMVVLRKLSAGLHRAEVRTMDRNWNLELRPALHEFEVVVPWYREPRVVGATLTGVAGVVFFAALAINRHLKLRRSHARVEKIVEERTRELERANRALLHGEKMTALGTLAAGIAHDFNNILSIIGGSAQIIESHPDDRQKVLTRVARIRTMVDQGTGIVRAMLGFGRASEPHIGACDLHTVIEQTTRLLGDRFLSRVRLTRFLAPQVPAVRAAPDLLQQSLVNLILNAADALQPDGEIQIETGRIEPPLPPMVLRPMDAPLYGFVAVRDNGCGIAPEVLPRIFEPFFTTKALSAQRGTGLGLYMVYEFARQAGHGILVESEPGRGSRFVLILPVMPEGPPVPAHPELAPGPFPDAHPS